MKKLSTKIAAVLLAGVLFTAAQAYAEPTELAEAPEYEYSETYDFVSEEFMEEELAIDYVLEDMIAFGYMQEDELTEEEIAIDYVLEDMIAAGYTVEDEYNVGITKEEELAIDYVLEDMIALGYIEEESLIQYSEESNYELSEEINENFLAEAN